MVYSGVNHSKNNSISERKKNVPLFLENRNKDDIENGSGGNNILMEENVIQKRYSSMQSIEGLLKEVGSSFQRLGNIVKMHEVMIDRFK